MKYFARAVKYFIGICILFTLIIIGLMLIGAVSKDINVLFRAGWKSVGMIALMFLGVSAVYPKFGYAKRLASIPGEDAELRPKVKEFFAERGYRLENETPEAMTFRSGSTWHRIVTMGEDRITVTPEFGGYGVEGLNRDIVRIKSGLEYRLRPNGD
ncbi:MAG: hypothetical protein IKP46_06520 [Bacteroidales bacterium]|nr:hypothetical protein [Bacteroidales bacterium]